MLIDVPRSVSDGQVFNIKSIGTGKVSASDTRNDKEVGTKELVSHRGFLKRLGDFGSREHLVRTRTTSACAENTVCGLAERIGFRFAWSLCGGTFRTL